MAAHLQVRGDRGRHPFGAVLDRQAVLQIMDHDDELVPTEASDAIARLQGCDDAVRHDGQHLVAGAVAQGLVDDPEVVQIDEQCTDRGAQAFRGMQIELEDVQDPCPVVQAGERIVERLVGQSLLSLVLGGGVLHLDHQLVRLPVVVAEQHPHPTDPDRGAVGPHQPKLGGALVARSGD